MRRAVTAVAAACILTAPTVLAFFSGGYFTEPRVIAAIVVWALVLALAVTGPAPLPRSVPGRLALAGLVLMTAWSALSITWAPLGGPAVQSVQRLLLYTGALLLAIGVLRRPRTIAAVEPALAAGATAVIAYGLSGRLLPGIVELSRSEAAGGRLEQPITYWNAEGALAAMGFVLAARLAGDRDRPAWMRALAAAAAAPLGAGVYLSYSRGAIAAAVLGLLVLVALAPSRAQLRGAAVALATGIGAAVCSAAFPAVAALEGASGDRSRDGAIVLALLVVAVVTAGRVTLRWASSDSDRLGDAPRWTRRLRPVAVAAVGLAALGLLIGGLGEKPSAADLARNADAGRLTTVSSNRYEYWRVGIVAFEREPLTGLGSGGFRVEWLRERPIAEAVKDTHSLEVEMAAELGIVGVLALALLIGGVGAASVAALRRRPEAAAGATAAALAWFLHASIDWDWQFPAVTLPAIVLAGTVIALQETDRVSAPARSPDRAPAPPRARVGR
ncbi:MAG TPA: O-antigen ligase family protein [Solirubrobacteraceae bacterium]|nr:O-antigen ligase family protein [Solirubrobacteraceae bacterium]